LPTNELYFSLAGAEEDQLEMLPFGLSRIGDCLAPSTIAAAVYDGHRYARELDDPPEPDEVPFRREYTGI
jgi:dimethylamine/trimethylamine dehydrogenase